MRQHRCAAAAVVLLVALFLPAVGGVAAASGGPVDYRPPVDAPVVDGFRPPTTRWGPGNRGLEYATVPGTPVGAAADGTVVFAGPVAGALHVTVEHADGLRTSYSYLATVEVRRGQRVRQGQRLATTGDRLHVGARLDGVYVDPALLFAGRLRLHVRLVPHDDPARAERVAALEEVRERELFAELVAGDGGGLFDAVVAVGGVLVDAGVERFRLLAHYGEALTRPVPERTLRLGLAVADGTGDPCTSGGVEPGPPAERRVAVLVGGLNSTDRDAAVDDVDTSRHGYEAADVVRFSYRGGVVPDDAAAWGGVLPSSGYGPDDTRGDIPRSGARLADLLEGVAAANPGAPVDVYAHSMGGLVLRAALDELRRRGRPLPDVVVTLGTPHDGADLATAGASLRLGPLGLPTWLGREAAERYGSEDGVAGRVADLDLWDPALRQLSEVSDVIRDLPPLPSDVDAIAIAARTDVIVPVPRSAGSGAPVVVVDSGFGLSAHDELPGSGPANRAIALHLAGMAPPCRSVAARTVDRVAGGTVSFLEDGVGALMTGFWLPAPP
ncbi:MAG: peptidoglycan DD-metalloendopeptidase family protein [Acidimicrobiales bacterium]|nr:peptidoglycan DD-metalloendopeptidase family protein [Acidimicrobiales bacterium]